MKRFIFFTFIQLMLLSFTAGAQDKKSTTAPVSKDWNRPPNYTEGMVPLPEKDLLLVPVKAAEVEPGNSTGAKGPVKTTTTEATKTPPLKIRAKKNPGK